MENHALRTGLILGIISILLSVTVYVIDTLLVIKWWFGLVALLLSLGFVIYYGLQFRNESGGFVSFKISYGYSMLTFVVSGLIGTVFNILLYNFIDPDLPEIISEAIIEQTAQMMEGFGASQEMIDKAIEEADTTSNFTTFGQIKSFGFALIVYAVMSLITGAIIKRKKPEFSDLT